MRVESIAEEFVKVDAQHDVFLFKTLCVEKGASNADAAEILIEFRRVELIDRSAVLDGEVHCGGFGIKLMHPVQADIHFASEGFKAFGFKHGDIEADGGEQ